jgi:hypothetical protein
MIDTSTVLSPIPDGLRKPLLSEYNEIVKNFMERRWAPSELSGGKLCEIVYTILEGYASGTYASVPTKPSNFVDACRRLEQNSSVPRSFQILIPRLLPTLYEIRNNRGVGHTGGDVDPNHMDAVAVLSMSNWLMAELVRVFHNLATDDAQKVVDSITERRVPLVWQSGGLKRVLDPHLTYPDQILLLLSSSSADVSIADLFQWTEHSNITSFKKILKQLHDKRFIEFNKKSDTVLILPPGANYIQKKISLRSETA